MLNIGRVGDRPRTKTVSETLTVAMPRDELECVVDVLFAEAYRRRRGDEEVPAVMLAAMRRMNAAMEGLNEPRLFARWLKLGARP